MIHSYSAKNFYSIKDRIKVDFTVPESVKDKISYVNDGDTATVSLIETVVGPNASGKTNALKVLAFTQWLVFRAYHDDPDHEIPLRPFGHHKSTSPTEISVTFSVDNRLFIYSFELTRKMIVKEVLKERSKTNQRITAKVMFSRTWNKDTKSYDFVDNAVGLSPDKLRKNASVIATAYRDNSPLAMIIARYWRDSVVTNVYERGYRDHHNMLSHNHLTKHAIEFFYENPKLRKQVESLLSRYDLGFGEFIKYEDKLNERSDFAIRHSSKEDVFDLPIEYESSGTKQVIIIFQYVLKALDNGGIAVIDEIDSNLHPEIVEELVSMFKSKGTNPNSAQILFSSHTPTILSSLDKYQIAFTEKKNGSTEFWRLDTIKGVRADENYYAKYIAGAYGGLPELS